MAFLALPLAVVGGAGAAELGQLVVLSSIFANSREQEREADSIGLVTLEKYGYPPEEASHVWRQLINERDATFKARKRKAPSEDLMFATHPQSDERMAALASQASQVVKPDKTYDNGKDRFQSVMKKYRPMLMDDQLKLNDFGGTQYLLDSFEGEGWPGELAYYKGELFRRRSQPGDLPMAISHYEQAVSHNDVPPQAHRALGYSLLKEGRKAEGKDALARYLTLVPNASDRAMVEFSLQ